MSARVTVRTRQPHTAVGVDAAVVQEPDPQVVQDGRFVEETESGQVVLPLQDVRVPQRREVRGGLHRVLDLLPVQRRVGGLGMGVRTSALTPIVAYTSYLSIRELQPELLVSRTEGLQQNRRDPHGLRVGDPHRRSLGTKHACGSKTWPL